MISFPNVPVKFLGICVLLFSSIDTKGAVTVAEDASVLVYEPFNKVRSHGWKETKVEVHMSGVMTSQVGMAKQVHAKKTKYYQPRVRITVFVSPHGQVWAGPSQDFYIETESNVVGGVFKSGDIFWCESLITNRPNEQIGLDVALDRLIEDVDAAKLERADASYPHKPEDLIDRVTELKDVFVAKNVFSVNSDVGGEELFSVDVRLNTVLLSFKSKVNPGATGRAWIDLRTKKLLKILTHQPDYPWKDIRMTKDGIEVIPKNLRFPQQEDYWLGSSAIACIAVLLLRWLRRRQKFRNVSNL